MNWKMNKIATQKVELLQNHSDFYGKLEIVDNGIFKDVAMIRDEIIQRLDAQSLLEYYNIPNFSNAKGEIRCPCPIHRGTHNNFRVKILDSLGTPMFRWNCFSHLCEKDVGGDVFGFCSGNE